VVAGLTAGIDGALLLALEKLDEFRDCGFFDAESFLAGMIGRLTIGFGRRAREWSEPR
jgi:hypothetical protein